jgi:hypothetical protein
MRSLTLVFCLLELLYFKLAVGYSLLEVFLAIWRNIGFTTVES